MKQILFIIISLFCLASFSMAKDDSAASDIGCGGKPKPSLPVGSTATDVACVCDSSGVCNWVFIDN